MSMLLQPMSLYANMLFQSIGKCLVASILASLRSGLYFIPLIIFLPRVIGITGIESAQTIADVLTAITAMPFLVGSFARSGV